MRSIEQLESRQLYSGIVFDPDTQTITVTGTAEADIVAVQPAPAEQITIILNGKTETFSTGMFTQTNISLLAGDDSVSIDALAPGFFSIDANDGFDTTTIVGRDAVHDEIDVSGDTIRLNGRATGLSSVESVVIDSLGGPDLISFFGLTSNPLKAITVLAGDGDDAIQFFDTQSFAGAVVNILGQSGIDSIFWGDNNSVSGHTFLATSGYIGIGDVGIIHHDAATETVYLHGGTLSDTFRIRLSTTTKYGIDAGGGLSTSPPDTLLVQKSGASNIATNFTSLGIGSVTALNRQPITFARVETIQLVFFVGSPTLGERLNEAGLANALLN